MNKIVTASEANRNFSKLLNDVKKGREIIITTHGEPVASLKPVERTDAVVRETAWKEFLEELRNRRAMNCEPWTRDDLYDDEAR